VRTSFPKAEPERPAMRGSRGCGIRGCACRRRGSATAPPTSTRAAPTAKTRTAPALKRTSLAKPIAARKPRRTKANPPTASTRRRKRAPSGVRATPVPTTPASFSFPSPMSFPLPGRTALIRRGWSTSSLGRSHARPARRRVTNALPGARTRVLRGSASSPGLDRHVRQCPFLPGWRLPDAELELASLLLGTKVNSGSM
jgi:hypothetical protein